MVPGWRAFVIFKATGTALLMVRTKGWTAHLDKHLRVQSLLRPSKCIIVAFIWPLHIFMGCWTSFLGRTP